MRKIEYSETSQIVTLLARERGLQRLIAKGAHRTTKAGASKFDGGLDLLEVGDAVFTHRPEKDLATLTEWKLREGHPCIRRDLRSLYLGLYAAELITLLLQEHDPHTHLYDRFERTLTELGTPRAEEAFLAFELDLLRETGIMPELGACVECGRAVGSRETACFSPSRGGVVCRNCESAAHDRISFDARLLGLVQAILRLPRANGAAQRLPRLTRHQTDPLNRILADHLLNTLGRPMRLTRYVL
jgi:DNA repair protein RecO (recombination protein O)